MNIELIKGNCLEAMNNIKDKSVDLILSELPYGTTDRFGAKNSGGTRIFKWDSVIPLDELWIHYKRILKNNGAVVLTADQPFTSILICSNLDWFKYEWIWKKDRTTGFLTANYRPMKQTEDIVVFSPAGAAAAAKNKMTYNAQGLIEKRVKKKNNPDRLGKVLGVKEFIGKGNKLLTTEEYEQKYTNYPREILEVSVVRKTTHPTQKPVDLMEYLIRTYSNEGDLVVDNCMGVGPTGIACIKAKRSFIGIELDEDFFNEAEKKIEKLIGSKGKNRKIDSFFN